MPLSTAIQVVLTRAGRGCLSRASQAAVGVLPLPPGWVLPGPLLGPAFCLSPSLFYDRLGGNASVDLSGSLCASRGRLRSQKWGWSFRPEPLGQLCVFLLGRLCVPPAAIAFPISPPGVITAITGVQCFSCEAVPSARDWPRLSFRHHNGGSFSFLLFLRRAAHLLPSRSVS